MSPNFSFSFYLKSINIAPVNASIDNKYILNTCSLRPRTMSALVLFSIHLMVRRKFLHVGSKTIECFSLNSLPNLQQDRQCADATLDQISMYGSLEATKQISGCSLGTLFQMEALRELTGSSSQLRVFQHYRELG